MDYLFLNAGECNDSLRDRDFYIVKAESRVQADVFLQVALLAIAQDTLLCGYATDHAVFAYTDGTLTMPDDVGDITQSIEGVNEYLPEGFEQAIWDIQQYADNDEMHVELRLDYKGCFWYFGNADYGVEFYHDTLTDTVKYTMVGG